MMWQPGNLPPVLVRPMFAFAVIAPLWGLTEAELKPFWIYRDISLSVGYLLFSALAAVTITMALKSVNPDFQVARRRVVTGIVLAAVAALAHFVCEFEHLSALPGPRADRLLESIRAIPPYAPVRAMLLLLPVFLAVSVFATGRWRVFAGSPLFVASMSFAMVLLAALHITRLPFTAGDMVLVALIALSATIAGLFLLWALASNDFIRTLVWPQEMPPTLDAMDGNNRLYLWLLGATVPFIATSASVLLAASAIWAVLCILTGRLVSAFDWRNFPVFAAFALFFTIMALSTIFHGETAEDRFVPVLRLFPFLSAFFVVPRLHRSPASVLLPHLAQGAAVGLYVFAVFALYEYFIAAARGPFEFRISVLSGNPVPAAYAVVAFMVAAATGLDRLPYRQFVFRTGALGAACATVTLTGSLSVLASIPILGLFLFLRYRRVIGDWRLRTQSGLHRPVLAIAVAATAILLVVVSSPVLQRASNYADAVIESTDSGESKSLSVRLMMWKAALAAVAQSPVTGHGVQNRFEALKPHLPESGADQQLHFTHPHSGFLTAAVAGGMPGLVAAFLMLLAPLAVAWRGPLVSGNADLVFYAAGISAIYLIGGMFGIMLFNDATDAVFCWVAIIVAAHMRVAAH